MESFFNGQADFISFIYGLLLMLVGVASLSNERQKDTRPNWNWFAIFGFLYGFNKWLDVLVMNLPGQSIFRVVNPMLTMGVYFLLFLFAISAYDFKPRAKRWILAAALAMSVFSGLQETPLLTGQAVRMLKYLFGGLAGLWSFGVLLKVARSGQYRSKYLYLAVVGIPAYSLLFAFHDFAKQWFYAVLGWPVDLFQMLFIGLTIIGIWIGREQYTELEYAKQQKRRWLDFSLNQILTIVLVTMLLVSWFYVNWEGRRQARRLQVSLETAASQSAVVFSQSDYLNISDQPLQIGSQTYHAFTEYLDEAATSFANVDRLRLVRPLADGRNLVVAESEHQNNIDKGEVSWLTDIPANLRDRLLLRQIVFAGPIVDSEGAWYSAMVPWRDFETGETVAFVQADIAAANYQEQVFFARLLAILPAALLFISLIAILVYRRRGRSAQIIFGEGYHGAYTWWLPPASLLLTLSSVVLVLFFEIRYANYSSLADRFNTYANSGFERLASFFVDATGEDVAGVYAFAQGSKEVPDFGEATLRRIKELFLSDTSALRWLNADGLSMLANGTGLVLSGELPVSRSSLPADNLIGEDLLRQEDYPPKLEEAIIDRKVVAVINDKGGIDLLIPSFLNANKLRGFLLASYDLNSLSRKALANSSRRDLVFQLEYGDKHDDQHRVFFRHNIANRYSGAYGGAKNLNFSAPMNFADLVMVAKIYPADSFVRDNASYSHWVVLAGGLSFSLLLSVYLAIVLIGRQRARALVEERSKEVLRQKNRLQQYIDIAEVAVVVFNADNQLVLLNRYGQGLAKQLIKGGKIDKAWIDGYLALEQSKPLAKELASLAAGRKQVSGNIRTEFTTLTGAKRQFIWRFARLKMEKESTLIGVGTEITELVSAQVTIDQLKEFDRLKDEILKVTSHEFKTPLVSIVGLSEVMYKKRQQLPQGFNNYIDVIHRESLRLNDLVQKMVEAARHEKSQVVAKKEAFDLVALLAGLPDSLQLLLQRNGSRLKFVSAVPELGIVSDAGKITQVVNNLLDNAVKYGKAGQIILLRLSLSGRRAVKVEVIDQGPGVQEADKDRLFEKFYRIDSSLTRSQEGIGLGLYLCKQNIELLGGQIGVQNQAEGGANFYFILPLK